MIKKKELRAAFSRRLEKVREALGMTHEDIARHFGVDRTTYTKSENGVSFPSITSLYTLCHRFDVSMDWLLAGKGIMFYKDKVKPPLQAASEEAAAVGKVVAVVEKQVADMLEHMEKVPLLKHDLMSFFYHYLEDNSGMVARHMNPPAEPGENSG
jgi:transcriptional regulator with XRE-family HTH domain